VSWKNSNFGFRGRLRIIFYDIGWSFGAPVFKGGAKSRTIQFIQVPTAKFRTWSQRGVSTDGGSYDYLRVRAESVPTFTFLQKWFRTSAKGETKSNKNKIFEEV